MSKENDSIFSGRKMTVEYVCVYCGMRAPRSVKAGRPRGNAQSVNIQAELICRIAGL